MSAKLTEDVPARKSSLTLVENALTGSNKACPLKEILRIIVCTDESKDRPSIEEVLCMNLFLSVSQCSPRWVPFWVSTSTSWPSISTTQLKRLPVHLMTNKKEAWNRKLIRVRILDLFKFTRQRTRSHQKGHQPTYAWHKFWTLLASLISLSTWAGTSKGKELKSRPTSMIYKLSW